MEKQSFAAFVYWSFLSVIAGSVGFGVVILREMAQSMEELNVRIAVIIEAQKTQDFRLNEQAKRIDKIEDRCEKCG